jgi:hypothetical protein
LLLGAVMGRRLDFLLGRMTQLKWLLGHEPPRGEREREYWITNESLWEPGGKKKESKKKRKKKRKEREKRNELFYLFLKITIHKF